MAIGPSAVPVWAQEGSPNAEAGSATGTQTTPPPGETQAPDSAAGTADGPDPENTDAGLTQEGTLRREIVTASFYELSSLLRELGLSTRGSRTELQNRLLDHYGLPAETEPEAQEQRRVVIEESDQVRYSEVEMDDGTTERFVRMTGGVFIRLSDPDQGVVHTITADEVVYNETTEVVTASGEIEYAIEREGEREVFRGEGLSFNLENYEGLFLDGISSRPRTIEGRELEFSFEGRTLSRSEADVVVLENGVITSSTADPPNYYIGAERVWVLAPGEWGLENALLYVGRVPMLAIPFFFNPADQIVFHPSVGFSPINGPYVQTTTYLFGEKEETDSPLSILSIAEEEAEDRPLVRRGIFLRGSDTAGEPSYPENWLLKLKTDIYANRGVYAGVEGSLPGLAGLDRFRFSGAVAVSREVYRTGESYSTLYQDPNDSIFRSYPHFSYLFGGEVPIRFGVDTEASIRFGFGSASAQIQGYSDPFLNAHFAGRSEDIQWLRLLGLEDDESAAGSRVSGFRWRVSAALTPTMSATAPLLQSLQVSPIATTLSFSSKNVPASELAPERRDAVESPMASFYVPDSLVAPDIGVRLSGTILQFPFADRSPAQTPSGPVGENPLRPPWENAPQAEEAPEAPPAQPPGIRPSLPVGGDPGQPRFSLSYQVAPAANLTHRFASSGWALPADVDYTMEHSNATVRGSASLSYRFSLADNVFGVNGSTGFSGQYRAYFNRGPEVTDPTWQNLQLQADRFASLGITSDLRLNGLPLAFLPVVSRTSLNYDISTVLLRTEYESQDDNDNPVYTTDTIDWTDEFIRNHSAGANIVADLEPGSQSLRMTAALPPLTGRFSGSLSSTLGPVTLGAGISVRQSASDDTEWTWDPLGIQGTLRLGPLNVNQSASVNVEAPELDLLSTTISYEGLSARAQFRRTTGFEFGGPGIGWVPDGNEEQFRAVSSSLSASLPIVDATYWRNRIGLSLTLNAGLDLSFLRFTDSSLNFGLDLELSIHEFMDLRFSSRSQNAFIYQYIPELATQVGRPSRSFFLDLLRSFNFFTEQDRIDSDFNLQRLSIGLVHYMGDWDLSLDYSGTPRLETDDAGNRRFVWADSLTISLAWKPIPEIKSDVTIDEDTVSF